VHLKLAVEQPERKSHFTTRCLSCDDFSDEVLLLHTGKSSIETLEFVAQTLVVDAAEVQNGGIEVVQMRGIRGDVVTEVICFAIACAAFDTSSCHPHAEVSRVMITTVIRLR
jgi:hypothetical protein